MSVEVRPDFERIRKAARHEEPDRVPLCEVLIEYPIQSRFLGREVKEVDLASQIEFWSKAGYDYIPLTVGMMSPGKVTEESAITRAIRDAMFREEAAADARSWNLEYTSFIKNRADLERFPWELAAKMDFGKIEEAATLLPLGMKAIAVSGKIFTLAWMLMGFNNFSMSLLMDEELVADVFRRVAEIQFQALDRIFEMPHVGAVWAVDDLAFGTGPMISPQAFRDHVFPWYREIAARCHRNGLLFFLHSDGDLTPLLPDLIDLGLDVLQPVDPTCLDIFAVKEQFGDRLCLAGNVSNELLRAGTPQEVDAEVRKLIQGLAPGGGYCLGSGNSVPAWAKFENYEAMRRAAFTYGAYPVQA
ncbi:MAG: uroporphyrinogen decarboxylase family protein [Deferrisomatales bacterium]|nr:uroporphyrinogen decarboxylase family protein [Deferrisomatales bacterium]